MRADELLVLQYDDLAARVETFYRQLENSVPFRELFIRNPAGVISQTILADDLPPPSASLNQANRLFFSLLSNKKFSAWATRYQKQLERQARQVANVPDPDEALRIYTVQMDR